jgi:hypothetical protein
MSNRATLLFLSASQRTSRRRRYAYPRIVSLFFVHIFLSLVTVFGYTKPVQAGIEDLRVDHLSCSAEYWPGKAGLDYIVSGRATNSGADVISNFSVSVRLFSPDKREVLLTGSAGDYISGRIQANQSFRFNALVNVLSLHDIPDEYKHVRLPAKVSFGWPEVDGHEFGPVACPPTEP